MKIEALLRHPLLTMAPEDRCIEAARRMRIEGVGSVVVSEKGRPLGVVTDRDLAVRVIAAGLDPEKVPLREVMSSEPIYLSTGGCVDDLLKTMREQGIRRMPIVDPKGALVGVVTLDDVLLWLTEKLSQVASIIHRATDFGMPDPESQSAEGSSRGRS